MIDLRGCPVPEGNVADSATFMPQVQRLRDQFGIEQMVLVGDHGMFCHKPSLNCVSSRGWIGLLR
ncbi:MAG: hypothetical protein LBQ20_12535 [Rhodanobacter sp.]|jgi:transposase|nr:hypothetical protein [Rhodanobacter sp.]